jgi:hypothetical protein
VAVLVQRHSVQDRHLDGTLKLVLSHCPETLSQEKVFWVWQLVLGVERLDASHRVPAGRLGRQYDEEIKKVKGTQI